MEQAGFEHAFAGSSFFTAAISGFFSTAGAAEQEPLEQDDDLLPKIPSTDSVLSAMLAATTNSNILTSCHKNYPALLPEIEVYKCK